MKRLLLIGLLLFGIGHVAAYAQNDDIYFNSADIEKQKKEDRRQAEDDEREQAARADQSKNDYSGSYGNQGGYESYGKSYGNDGYSDYDNDYYYASRINRFNYPFYNMGYYSAFYNPYWYDPYWYDPYWGWSAWNRPGFSVSFGVGPYWNSYWGWYTWWGYPAYYSCWSYPYYAGWYGNPYYSGYWNGYYAGLYNGGGSVRTVNYGPRHSTNAINNNSVRRALYNTPVSGSNVGSRAPQRVGGSAEPVTNNRGAGTVRPSAGAETDRNNGDRRAADRGETQQPAGDRPGRAVFSPSEQRSGDFSDRARPMNDGGRFDGGRVPGADRPMADPQREQPVRQPRYEQQRMEQPRMEQPRYEQPRSEPRYQPQQSQPRYEAPRMESPRMSPAPAPARGGFGGRR